MVNPEFPDKARDGPSLVRAAEYVRMSTDHQRYSTENQAAAIQTYAARRGMEIVRRAASTIRGKARSTPTTLVFIRFSPGIAGQFDGLRTIRSACT